MADERRKKIEENTSWADRFSEAFSMKDVSQRRRDMEDKADANIREKERQAQLEALRKRRGGT